MNKQEPSQSPLQEHAKGQRRREGRYYVQSLTQHIFLVRECLSAAAEPGPDDRIVRSFDLHHDASSYADSMNNGQHDR
jgi:hypothetical protein